MVHTLCEVRVFQFRCEVPDRIQLGDSGFIEILKALEYVSTAFFARGVGLKLTSMISGTYS